MLPTTIKPMTAKVSQPFDSPQFTYEIKWDGYRCLAFLDSVGTRLQSRKENSFNFLFPELLTLHQKVKTLGSVLDGELVAIRDGKPSFLQLQKRGLLRNEQRIKAAVMNIPVIYVVFDLLYLNGEPIYREPIETRRSALRDILVPDDQVIISDYIEEQGVKYYESIAKLGLEGVVAKKKGSKYSLGKCVDDWCKFKNRRTDNFIIYGYKGKETIEELILGLYFNEKLIPVGSVSFGLRERKAVKKELDAIQTEINPFGGKSKKKTGVVWLKPVVVCVVSYLEWTEANYIREPVFQHFNFEVSPEWCRV
jgi:DNA ligase D-like protein (predicted ligase)